MTQTFRATDMSFADRSSPAAGLMLRAWTGAEIELGLQEWRALESRMGDVPLMCSHLWTASWLRVYRDQVPAAIVALERAGQTIAAALVTRGVRQKSGPVPIRTLHVGTAGERHGHSVCVEYNGMLCERANRPAMIAALQSWLAAQGQVDELRLDGWPAAEVSEWSWPTSPSESRLRDCKYFDLDKARDGKVEPIELLGRSTRQNIRRILRKYGDIETTWAASLEDADDILTDLIRLHQARWQSAGQPGAFSSASFEAFQRQLLVQGFDDQKVVLFRARHQGESIGCLMLLVDRGRMLDYVSGFASFEQKPSPGLVTHYLCLSEAARRGYRAYDFLVGDKRHKDNLSTDIQQLAWATWRRRTLRNTAIDALKYLKKLRTKNPGFSPGSQDKASSETQPTSPEAGVLEALSPSEAKPTEALSAHS
jgi:CelD/BcsL family acetyltransferase involved in cellulose biosynthesis